MGEGQNDPPFGSDSLSASLLSIPDLSFDSDWSGKFLLSYLHLAVTAGFSFQLPDFQGGMWGSLDFGVVFLMRWCNCKSMINRWPCLSVVNDEIMIELCAKTQVSQ